MLQPLLRIELQSPGRECLYLGHQLVGSVLSGLPRVLSLDEVHLERFVEDDYHMLDLVVHLDE